MEKYLEEQLKKLEETGIYIAKPSIEIDEIVNMDEYDFGELTLDELDNYMGSINQHILYIQQETNKSKAREMILGNQFKKRARWVFAQLSPEQRKGRNSVDERYHLVCEHDKLANQLFNEWEKSQIISNLMDDMPDRYIEVLNVLKKVHADKMEERRNTM